MKRVLLLSLLLSALGLALAGVSVSPSLPKALEGKSWPQGTQFALLDANGNVVWQPGQPTDHLSQAAVLRITLPDGSVYQVAVKVVGQGRGLGEVKLTVDGKLVPLPELLRAKGFTVDANGNLVKKGQSEEGAQGRGHGEGHPPAQPPKGKGK
ncbi:hypothetical protein [Thermus thalpophilus]|uniref:hypothetical protein n=1 Tax=Thermus thalpophilus TaxID=2908147 RepID=UPI001FAA2AF3|nr:hypothetical protein [Thermus thalpophilus]